MIRSAAILSLVVLSAQSPSPPLDVPMRGPVRVVDISGHSPCLLWTAVEQFGRQAQVRVGFEQTPDCRSAPWLRYPSRAFLALDDLTPRQALDRLLAERPDYTWAVVDGVVVVRPTVAWSPSGSILNRPVQAFTLPPSHPHHALHAVFHAARPPLYREHTDVRLSAHPGKIDNPSVQVLLDRPHPITFEGGTLVQALNHITRPFGGSWQAAYEDEAGRKSLHVHLHTPDLNGGSTHLGTAPFDIPRP